MTIEEVINKCRNLDGNCYVYIKGGCIAWAGYQYSIPNFLLSYPVEYFEIIDENKIAIFI